MGVRGTLSLAHPQGNLRLDMSDGFLDFFFWGGRQKKKKEKKKIIAKKDQTAEKVVKVGTYWLIQGWAGQI